MRGALVALFPLMASTEWLAVSPAMTGVNAQEQTFNLTIKRRCAYGGKNQVCATQRWIKIGCRESGAQSGKGGLGWISVVISIGPLAPGTYRRFQSVNSRADDREVTPYLKGTPCLRQHS
jgi:hypothetical protein